jgi:NAD(P)-dependent dehydrogenase (short-subunit alcohol dehydrogenase family)
MNLQTMKNALIIGGSTGIGLDAAKRLGLRGATVTIAGRDTVKLKTVFVNRNWPTFDHPIWHTPLVNQLRGSGRSVVLRRP